MSVILREFWERIVGTTSPEEQRKQQRLEEAKKRYHDRLNEIKVTLKKAAKNEGAKAVLGQYLKEAETFASAGEYPEAMDKLEQLAAAADNAVEQLEFQAPKDQAQAIQNSTQLEFIWADVTTAKLPEEGRLDLLRKAVLTAIGKEDYATAKNGLKALDEAVKTARADQKAWQTASAGVPEQIEELRKAGEEEALTLLNEFNGIKQRAEEHGEFLAGRDLMPSLKRRVDNLVKGNPDRQKWIESLPDRREVKLNLADLKAWGGAAATAENGFTGRMNALQDKAGQKKFGEAVGLLDFLKGEVATAHAGYKELNAHTLAMADLTPTLNLAKNTPALNDEVTRLKGELTTAESNVTGANNLAGAARLPGLRAALQAKVTEVLNAYRAGGNSGVPGYSNQIRNRVAALYKPYQVLYKKATRGDPPKKPETPAIARHLTDLVTANKTLMDKFGANDFPAALIALEQGEQHAKDILVAIGQVDKAERALYQRYRPLEKQVLAARAAIADTEELRALKKAFSDLDTPFQQNWTARKYSDCIKAFPALKKAAEDLLKPIVSAKAKAVFDLPETNDTTKGAKSDAAANLVGNLSEGEIQALGPKEQAQLLQALRAKGNRITYYNSGPPPNRDDPKRVAQRKMYNAIEMDPQFLQEDKKKQQVLIDRLKNMPKFRQAKKDWGGMPLDKRKEVLTDLIKEQCKVFGTTEPPRILFEDFNTALNARGEREDPSDAGYFSKNKDITQTFIKVNTTNSCFDSFEETLDTLAHENSHNYQLQLINLYKAGQLPESDPRYNQVLLFMANESLEFGGAYVTGGEDFPTYQKQPKEEHAHVSGPAVAGGILTYLTELEESEQAMEGIEDLFA